MKKAVNEKRALRKATPKKKLAKKKAAIKGTELQTNADGKKTTGEKMAGALKEQPHGKGESVNTVPFALAESGVRSVEQSGDLQGLSNVELADSESVNELLEEGNAFEAEAVKGVEDAEDADEVEAQTHEVPQDDVPREYLGKE